MRTSAKHSRLVPLLFAAFLFMGCDAALTGPEPGGDRQEVTVPEPPTNAPAGSPEDRPATGAFCFQYEGDWYCPSEGDSRFPEAD